MGASMPSAPDTTSFPVIHTSFHGRSAELTALQDLILDESARLITLVGPAGVGKTRLAVRAGESIASTGTWRVEYISLAVARNEHELGESIARALGVAETDGESMARTIVDAFSGQSTLLILDNLEHLLDQAAAVSALLALESKVTILATSRAPLGIRGEHVFDIAPFELPEDASRRSLSEFAVFDAVALFVDRARAVQHDFVLTPSNRSAVAAICARLDGLPLALELAAARIRMLPPAILLERLDRPLEALRAGPFDAPDRHRSLRAALEWSFELLSSPERRLIARLAVPRGSFTLQAVEALSDDLDLEPLDAVASLVDKSLVRPAHVRRADGVEAVRFEMLAIVREFALEKLAETDDFARAHDRFANYIVALAAEVMAEFPLGPASGDASFDVLGVDREPTLAALDWLYRSGNHRTYVQAAAALAPHWFARGALRDARSILERARMLQAHADPADVARVTLANGMVAIQQGDFEVGEALLYSGLELARSTGQEDWIGQASFSLGVVEQDRGNPGSALPLFAAARTSFQATNRPLFAAVARNNLGLVTARMGDLREGLIQIDSARLEHRELGYSFGVALADRYAGQVLLEIGDLVGARKSLCESLKFEPASMQGWHIANALETLAYVDLAEGHVQRAAVLSEAAAHVREDIGVPLEPALSDKWTRFRQALEGRLDQDELAEACKTARDWSIEAAIAYATSAPSSEALATGETNATLTPRLSARENEVLALLIEGQTNAEIAMSLFISPRTVSVHVTHILEKLGVENRSAAVAMALRSGLMAGRADRSPNA